MKHLFISLFLFAATATQAQQHSIQKLWESDTTLAVPESVLVNPQANVLFVSLIDGEPWGMDGKGGIAKLDPSGKIINAAWITGLNAPKGMGIWNNLLYVADVSEVAVINIAKGTIENRIPVAGAQGLNDITIDGKGTVYVSDSKTGNVIEIKNGKATTYLTDLQGVNGLKAVDDDLYILTSKNVMKAGADRKLTTVAQLEYGGDGIEPVGDGDFVITAWSGYMHYLTPDGRKELLLDTHTQNKNTADIGYDAAQHIIYVPTFFGKSVVAYRLQ